MTPKRLSIVAIDTNVLIWGVRRHGPADKLERARWLFEAFERDGATIVLSAISVSEYLTAIPTEDHGKVLVELQRLFDIRPFDAQCVSVAASLFQHGKAGLSKGVAAARQTLRADAMIVATVLSSGASKFYSNDDGCRRLATRVGLVAEDLPAMPEYLPQLLPPDKAAPFSKSKKTQRD